jgi:integrase
MKKRSDGRFVKTVTVEGKRHFIYGDSQEEVDNKYIDLRINQKKGLVLNDKTTVGEMATKWYESHIMANKKLALKTKEMYAYIVNHHIKVFADYKLKEVKPLTIEEYINKLGKSKSLEHKIRITLGQIFKAAKANKLIEDNPMEYIKAVAPDEPKREFLEEDERNTVLGALEDRERAFKLVKTLLYTGMRLGEALALMWKDLDEKNNTISISKAVEFDEGKTNNKKTKTKAGNRVVPIPNEIKEMLVSDKGKSLYIFPQVNGKMHTQYSIYSFWKRVQDRVEKYINTLNEKKSEDEKIEKIHLTFRTLRHTYATGLYDADVDIKYAQYLLGHEDAQITMNIYTHISKFRHKENVFKIDSLYKNTAENTTEESKENEDSVAKSN